MPSSNTATDGRSDPLIGSVVAGKYRIRKLIGRGGVGLVYLATQNADAGPDRDVVVKVLGPQWASDSETMARFEREAKRLSTLRHPNIVRMLDHGREGDRAYLVMEYCNGELLSDYVQRNRALTLEQFVPIAAQLLKGIGHCHARAMMVRDIKPQNIMLVERKGRANFVKVLDFGLAKLLKEDQSVTEQHVIGTVGYLSPEQIRGEELDLRVDVYAAGILFYLMLSGRLPFDGETNATVFYKTVNEPAPYLREMLPEGSNVPEGLIALVHACLEKDRSLRPNDAETIVKRLINVVPAPLFRLPRADTAHHGVASNVVPPGHGNTGMMQLLGAEASPSVPIPVADDVVEATSPAVAPTRRGRQRTFVAGALALAGLVALAWWTGGRGDPTEVATAAAAPTASNPREGATLGATLAAAREAIEGQRLSEAVAALDSVDASLLSDAAQRSEHTRLKRELELLRLLEAAKAFAADGKTAAANQAYRDALAIDAAYPPALEALAALAGTERPANATSKVEVSITASVPGTVYIDGASAGRTPLHRALALGRHEIQVRANGYNPHTEVIEVTEDGQASVAAVLHKRGGRRTTPTPAAATPGPPKPAPSPKPEPEPEPEPTAKAKPGPFLPTKHEDRGSVFLRTKDD